jgi:hypothetical protein
MQHNKFLSAAIALCLIAIFTMSGAPSPTAKPTPVTFVFTAGTHTLTITGAIEATGTYTMNPVVITGRTAHCTNNLVTPYGTITALSSCQSNSSGVGTIGTWHIVNGTGAYANLRGNGKLVMYYNADPGGETWNGWIR